MAGSRARRYVQAAAATLVALAALALVSLGPSGVILLWRAYGELQADAGARTGIGEPVRDGTVTFVLHEVRCGPDGGAVNGQVCEVTIAARNDGTGNIAVPARAQMLEVSKGARHLPSNSDSAQFGELAPQETTTTVIRYDIPDDATPTHIEVRGHTYSRGTPIPIGTPYPRPVPG